MQEEVDTRTIRRRKGVYQVEILSVTTVFSRVVARFALVLLYRASGDVYYKALFYCLPYSCQVTGGWTLECNVDTRGVAVCGMLPPSPHPQVSQPHTSLADESFKHPSCMLSRDCASCQYPFHVLSLSIARRIPQSDEAGGNRIAKPCMSIYRV